MTVNQKLTEQFHNYCNKRKISLTVEITKEQIEEFLNLTLENESQYLKTVNGKHFFKVGQDTYLVSGLESRREVKFY